MNLKGIISISGKPGLFKVIAQGNNTLIVESLIDRKRIPAHSTSKVSALEDISIYTTDEDMPLGEVMQKIFDKESGKASIDHKEEPSKLHSYFEKILPDYDKERVYNSDLKKLFSWYNLLVSSGMFEELIKTEEEAKEKEKAAKSAEKKAPAKKVADTEEKTSEEKPKKTAKKKAASSDEKEEKPKAKKPAAKKTTTAKKTTSKKKEE